MWTSPFLPQSAHSGAISLFHVHSHRSLKRFRLDSEHAVIVGIERNLNRRITFWKSRQVEPCTVVPRDLHAIYIYVGMALAQHMIRACPLRSKAEIFRHDMKIVAANRILRDTDFQGRCIGTARYRGSPVVVVASGLAGMISFELH